MKGRVTQIRRTVPMEAFLRGIGTPVLGMLVEWPFRSGTPWKVTEIRETEVELEVTQE